jgi:hypothetical protein
LLGPSHPEAAQSAQSIVDDQFVTAADKRVRCEADLAIDGINGFLDSRRPFP